MLVLTLPLPIKNRWFLQGSQIKEDLDFLRQRYLLAVTQDPVSLVIRGLWGHLWLQYEPSSFPCLLLLLSRCDGPGSQLKGSALAFASHPRHRPFLAFVAVGVAPLQAPEPKYVAQLQRRSGKHRWPCRAQRDGVDPGGPLPAALQCPPSVPQWVCWGRLLPPLMPKGRML